MLFVTNREPQGSIRTRVNRAYKFDLKKNAPSNSIYCCERVGKDDYIELGAYGLMSKLRDSNAKQILFFIHGFSNLPEPDIFPRVEKLQKYFDTKEQDLVQVIPIIWPCDDDPGIVKDYWDDQKSADLSAFSFSRALQFLWHGEIRSLKIIPASNALIYSHTLWAIGYSERRFPSGINMI